MPPVSNIARPDRIFVPNFVRLLGRQVLLGWIAVGLLSLSGCDILFTNAGVTTENPNNNNTAQTPNTYGNVAASPLSSPYGASNSVPAAARDILKYKFVTGRDEKYDLDFKLNNGSGRAVSVSAYSGFVATPADASSISSPTVQGSGTAWAITADGYLVTCAHVVDGASQISVTLNNQTYSGTVLASDTILDLAVLKIPANNLTPLALAPDGTLEQGQEVRSVGFPLSTVLGESIKINRGSIAGFVNIDGRELVQIDVPINPGNSGGPVVDTRGNVVGVASEKLAGAEISSVGFCVPSSVVRNWVSKFAPIKIGTSRSELSGTELSKKVSPSVALVKATLGGINPNNRSYSVRGSGWYSIERPGVFSLGTNSHHDSGSLAMDDSGKSVEQRECLQLPFLLGPLATFAVPPLSENGAQQWNRTDKLQIAATSEEEAEEDPLMGMFPGRYRGLPGFGRRPTQRVVTLISAIRVENYQILSADSTTVKIQKRWEINTEPAPTANIRISCTGTGEWSFDRQLGLMKTITGNASYVTEQQGVQVTLPIEITGRRATEEFEKLVRDQKEEPPTTESPSRRSSAAKSTSSAENTSQSEEADPELKEAIDGLTGPVDRSKRLRALEKLAPITIDSSSRNDVVSALVSNLDHSDPEVKAGALKALAKWDTATAVSRVIDLLDDSDSTVVLAAIHYLGVAHDVDAADELGELVKNSEEYRDAASKALIEIGPGAEAVVIVLLKNKTTEIRRSACKILAKIGSDESIPLLLKLANSNTACSRDAKDALSELGISD